MLGTAKDLDAYVRSLDQSDKDSPILRKAIGQTYQARGKFDKAIVQLRLAADMQPADVDVQRALVACYEPSARSTRERWRCSRKSMSIITIWLFISSLPID